MTYLPITVTDELRSRIATRKQELTAELRRTGLFDWSKKTLLRSQISSIEVLLLGIEGARAIENATGVHTPPYCKETHESLVDQYALLLLRQATTA